MKFSFKTEMFCVLLIVLSELVLIHVPTAIFWKYIIVAEILFLITILVVMISGKTRKATTENIRGLARYSNQLNSRISYRALNFAEIWHGVTIFCLAKVKYCESTHQWDTEDGTERLYKLEEDEVSDELKEIVRTCQKEKKGPDCLLVYYDGKTLRLLQPRVR